MRAAIDMSVVRCLRLRRPSSRILLSGGALAVALLALQAIVSPARADAILGLPDPAEIVEDGVKSSFDFVIEQLFGGIPTKLTEAAISWQLHLPSEAFTSSNVAQLNRTTTAAAFALLGLVMTATVLRYWLAGVLEGAGGTEGITGFARGIAAALGVIAWPWVFNSSIALVNSLTYELIHARSVHDDVSRMLGAAVGISITNGPVGMLASAVVVIAGTLLMLGLFTLHIVLASALVVMFVGGPLLIVLAPFPGTAWMSALAFRAFATLLAWPVIWAICFACFAAVFNDFVTFRGDGGVLDKALIKPLTGVAMLYLCVRLPLLATKASMLGIGGVGAVGFAARYLAVRQASTHLAGSSGSDRTATPTRRYATSAKARSGASESSSSTSVAAAPAPEGASGKVVGSPRDSSPMRGSRAVDQAADSSAASTTRAIATNSPASLRSLGERPRQLEEEMHRARRRAGTPGAPAAVTDGDVAAALRRLEPGRAASIATVYDRAISSGHNREEAMAAVTRASAIGVARAEDDMAPHEAHAYRTLGSAPSHALAGGLEAYRAERKVDAGAAPSRAAQVIDSPTPLPRPSVPPRRSGGVS